MPSSFVAVLAMFMGLTIIPAIREFLPTSVRLVTAGALTIVATNQTFTWDSSLNASHSASIVVGVALVCVPIAFATESIAVAGRLIDLSRGAQVVEQTLTDHSRVSLLEQMAKLVAVVWIFAIDGQQFATLLLKVLSHSTSTSLSIPSSLKIFAEGLYCGMYIAAPFFALALLIDCSSMWLAKFAPRLTISNELLPVKLCLLSLCLALRLSTPTEILTDLEERTVEQISASEHGR
jgi:flagellar biosynthesis protein FliR